DEVTDTHLGHDRDGHRLDDAVDHVGVGHAGHATVLADVDGDPFQCHDRDGTGVLGDLGLFGGDDVHDDAVLQVFERAVLGTLGVAGAVGGVRCHVGHGGGLPARVLTEGIRLCPGPRRVSTLKSTRTILGATHPGASGAPW